MKGGEKVSKISSSDISLKFQNFNLMSHAQENIDSCAFWSEI